MIKGGYYLKARCVQTSEVNFAPPVVRELWDYLLRNANYADKRYNGFKIKRGQLFRSYKEIIDDLSWKVGWRKMHYSENQMKKAMKFLRSTSMITTTKELGGVLITVLNYDYFQDQKNYDNTCEGTSESTNEGTIEEPLRNQTIPDNNKERKRKNKEIYALFEQFWRAYPKKKAKDSALKAFQKVKPDGELLSSMLKAIEKSKATNDWLKDGGQFIPYPATWLNNRRWEDEETVMGRELEA